MTVLPDIIREAVIIPAKPAQLNGSNIHINSLGDFNNNQTTSQSSSLNPTPQNDVKNIKSAPQQTYTAEEAHKYFPYLILNNKARSTCYKSTDSDGKFSVKSSPLATNIQYKWPHLQRQKSEFVGGTNKNTKSHFHKSLVRLPQPSRPDQPYRVDASWETVETHFHNEKRNLDMKRQQYAREHSMWSIYPYGTIEEREFYNKRLRETLKKQIDEKTLAGQSEFMKKFKESAYMREKDNDDLEIEKLKQNERVKYLQQYSVSNKKLMEDKWMNEYFYKRDEWNKEKQLLTEDQLNGVKH